MIVPIVGSRSAAPPRYTPFCRLVGWACMCWSQPATAAKDACPSVLRVALRRAESAEALEVSAWPSMPGPWPRHLLTPASVASGASRDRGVRRRPTAASWGSAADVSIRRAAVLTFAFPYPHRVNRFDLRAARAISARRGPRAAAVFFYSSINTSRTGFGGTNRTGCRTMHQRTAPAVIADTSDDCLGVKRSGVRISPARLRKSCPEGLQTMPSAARPRVESVRGLGARRRRLEGVRRSGLGRCRVVGWLAETAPASRDAREPASPVRRRHSANPRRLVAESLDSLVDQLFVHEVHGCSFRSLVPAEAMTQNPLWTRSGLDVERGGRLID